MKSEMDKHGREHKMAALSEKIIDMIFSDRLAEAERLIESEGDNLDKSESHRLLALSAVIESKKGELQSGIKLIRQAVQEKPSWLPHLYRLSVILMDAKQWAEAELSLSELIFLSLNKDDNYFLDEARFRRVLCLRKLERYSEFQAAKQELPKEASFFIEDRLYYIDDIS